MTFIRKTFSKYLFKTTLRRSNDWLLLQNTLSKVFYLQKVSKNEMLKQVGVNPNEIYSKTFSKSLF